MYWSNFSYVRENCHQCMPVTLVKIPMVLQNSQEQWVINTTIWSAAHILQELCETGMYMFSIIAEICMHGI